MSFFTVPSVALEQPHVAWAIHRLFLTKNSAVWPWARHSSWYAVLTLQHVNIFQETADRYPVPK